MITFNNLEITEYTNFCRVFEIPLELSEQFCAGGGVPTNFQMVDWFNPIPTSLFWKDQQDKHKSWEHYREGVIDFVKSKNYFKAGRRYIVITNFNDSFIIQG